MSELLDLSPGAIFANQFKVVRPLARGGMGAVYVVEQLGTARERALKLMHPQIASDDKAIERFEREAQVASKIESDHVVEVIGAGVDVETATPWLCMELLKGETLADRCEKAGRLSREDALEVIKQLGHALSAAHRAGIVHRDLKPENIFLATPRREGVPFTLKVLDFGVAALVADAQGAKTTQGVGSPMWMAPEQTNVGRVTTATDVWALGLIAFYLITGKAYWKAPSIEGSSLTALLVEMMVEEMPPASVRARELLASGLVPDGFDAWFAQAVERDPNKRFRDATAAIPPLVAILEGAPARSPVAGPSAFEATAAIDAAALPATRPAAELPTPVTPAALVSAPPRGSRAGVVMVGAFVLVAALGGGIALVMSGGETPPTAIAATTPATAVATAADTPAADDESDEAAGDEAARDEGDEGDEAAGDEGGEGDEAARDEAARDDSEDDDSEDDEATETETDDSEDDETTETTEPAPTPATTRPRPRPRAAATSPAARAARSMLLDACWRDTFEGEPPPPPERWSFDFALGPSGAATNVIIRGPTNGPYSSFRRCIVGRVGQYRPADGTTHVELTLP